MKKQYPANTLGYHDDLASLLFAGYHRPRRKELLSKLETYRNHIPELLRMATDHGLLGHERKNPLFWAPHTAWDVLGMLRPPAALDTLVCLAMTAPRSHLTREKTTSADYLYADMPEIFRNYKFKDVRQTIHRYLAHNANSFTIHGRRILAGGILMFVTVKRYRKAVAAFYRRYLQKSEFISKDFSAICAQCLMVMKSREDFQLILTLFTEKQIEGTDYDIESFVEDLQVYRETLDSFDPDPELDEIIVAAESLIDRKNEFNDFIRKVTSKINILDILKAGNPQAEIMASMIEGVMPDREEFRKFLSYNNANILQRQLFNNLFLQMTPGNFAQLCEKLNVFSNSKLISEINDASYKYARNKLAESPEWLQMELSDALKQIDYSSAKEISLMLMHDMKIESTAESVRNMVESDFPLAQDDYQFLCLIAHYHLITRLENKQLLPEFEPFKLELSHLYAEFLTDPPSHEKADAALEKTIVARCLNVEILVDYFKLRGNAKKTGDSSDDFYNFYPEILDYPDTDK